MNFWENVPEIDSELSRVRQRIDMQIAFGGSVMQPRLEELFSRDAKMLRPAFTILAARIQGGERRATDRVINLAAAIEMLHVASLIHDDIVDNARHRRGGPAVHVQYGPREAVLMGDFLFARCFAAVAESASPENARLLSAAVSRIIGAEIDESTSEARPSVRTYLRRIIGKTAILFAASFHVGATESGDDAYVAQLLRRIGYNVGVGFQIIDDILDIAGNANKTGKPSGTDLRAGILTLPTILSAKSDATIERAAARLTAAGNPLVRTMGARKVRRAVLMNGGVEAAQKWAARYTQRANKELALLPEGPGTETLRNTISRLRSRSA